MNTQDIIRQAVEEYDALTDQDVAGWIEDLARRIDTQTAAAEHSPRDWFTRGRFPSCSCGLDPHDNAKLIAHWAENGIRWVDEQGRLTAYLVEVTA